MKNLSGVFDKNRNYYCYLCCDGHGTGLSPKAGEEYETMIGFLLIVDTITWPAVLSYFY